MKKKSIFICAAAAFAGGQMSAADNDAAVDTVISLNDVEIVANRANSKTPVAYTNVRRADIEKMNDGRDIPYLLSMTPSLITTSDARWRSRIHFLESERFRWFAHKRDGQWNSCKRR